MPIYVQNSLLPSVVARPLHGDVPTIDLVMSRRGLLQNGDIGNFAVSGPNRPNRVSHSDSAHSFGSGRMTGDPNAFNKSFEVRILHRILHSSGKPQKCSQERVSDEKHGEVTYKDRNVPKKPEEHDSNCAQE